MTQYYNDDLADPDCILVRPIGTKKSAPLAYCKWAAGEWEAKFYANTPTHRWECDTTLRLMNNDGSWFKKKIKIDRRKATRNNKAKGARRQ